MFLYAKMNLNYWTSAGSGIHRAFKESPVRGLEKSKIHQHQHVNFSPAIVSLRVIIAPVQFQNTGECIDQSLGASRVRPGRQHALCRPATEDSPSNHGPSWNLLGRSRRQAASCIGYVYFSLALSLLATLLLFIFFLFLFLFCFVPTISHRACTDGQKDDETSAHPRPPPIYNHAVESKMLTSAFVECF